MNESRCILSVILLVLPVAASAKERPGLAALNLKAQRNVDTGLAEMISEAMLSELRATERFKSVIGSSDVADLVSAEQQKQALGCDDDSCLAQLGGALGVPYLLSGSLGVVGGRFMLNIKLLAVDDAKVAGRITQLFEGERALVDGLKSTLGILLNDAFAPSKENPKVALDRTTTASPWKRWTAVGLGLLGTGVGGYSFLHVAESQTAYDAAPSVHTSEALTTAAEQGDLMIILSAVSVAAAAGLLAWSL